MSIKQGQLSKHPPASFRELASIALPTAGSLISSYLLLLTDRLLLSRFSLEALEGCTTAFSFFFLFQMLILRFVSTNQSFVGEAHGKWQIEKACSFTWQMIWASLALPLFIVPIGLFFGRPFFQGTPVEQEALTYLTYMLVGSVLFALEGALSSFFLGVGNSKKVLKVHLFSHPLNIAISALLIFGIPHAFQPLGIHGAAIGTLIAKGVSCALLFRAFLKKHPTTTTLRGIAKLSTEKMKLCIVNALPRALGQSFLIWVWNYTARFLIAAGGIDLMVLTFGASVFIQVLNDAVGAAVLSSTSYILGANKLDLIPRMLRSALLLIFFNLSLLTLPFLIFSRPLVTAFFGSQIAPSDLHTLMQTSNLIYLNFVVSAVYMVIFMVLTALKDMRFYLIAHTTITPLPLYFLIKYMHTQPYWNPNLFWLLTAAQSVIMSLVYITRISTQLNKLKEGNMKQQTSSLDDLKEYS